MSGEVDCCENCSTSFSLFKRKKHCTICNQSFCPSCLSRSTTTSSGSSDSSERICVVCQSIFSQYANTDDLMKLKLKHLRAVLTKAKISTQTCKDKRDLAELILRNRNRLYSPKTSTSNNNNNSSTSGSSSSQTGGSARASGVNNNNVRRNSNHSTGNQQQQQQAQSSSSNPFSSFMNNVQDFVNFNLNSVLNNSVPCPAPPPPPPQRPASTNNNNYYNNVNNNNSSNHSSTSSSTHSANSIPNLNSVFNMLGDQFANPFNPPNTATTATASSYPGTTGGFPFNSSPFTTTTNRSNNRNSESNTSYEDVSPPPPQTSTTSAGATTNNSTTSSTAADGSTRVTTTKRRASLSDLKSEQDIDHLSIRQIKEILASNFVDYKGCCERRELVDKLRRLYTSDKENKKLEERLNNPTTTTSRLDDGTTNAAAGTSSSSVHSPPHAQPPAPSIESELCKICMESVIDCVLLDCGHMCSCIKCGKQLAECPICRQNVVRVVRVFKS